MERICDKLNIVDCFVSIQGEGIYAGYPSLFIRVSGCNLRCCFKGSVCDTAYSSFNPEKGIYTKDDIIKSLDQYSNVKHIVVTGGEPMLYQKELVDLFQYIHGEYYLITIETNGTIAPIDEMEEFVALYSMSPKLNTSIPEPNFVYQVPVNGEMIPKSFTKKECDALNEKRINIEAICKMINQSDYQLKFVYSNEDSLKEILEILDRIDKYMEENGGYPVISNYVMLMPEGITSEQINENGRKAVDICIKHGWVYTDRLHIRLWGDQRGY